MLFDVRQDNRAAVRDDTIGRTSRTRPEGDVLLVDIVRWTEAF